MSSRDRLGSQTVAVPDFSPDTFDGFCIWKGLPKLVAFFTLSLKSLGGFVL
jgi:hypothetical protein